MKAIVNTGAGDVSVLRLEDVPAPVAGPRQVRVRVHGAGLNRADILQRKGRYPVPPGWPADIPGLEYAGEIESLGQGALRWRIGDRVMGLVGGGAHAEYVVVHEDETMAIPPGLSFTEAAAIPEVFLTAWDALVMRGRLKTGERVLIHAVGSGVGTAATQLGRWLGATTLGTSRNATKLDQARAYGLDIGIDTSAGSFRDAVDPPVDIVIDVLGGPAFADNLHVLARRGRLVMLGQLQGSKADADFEPLLRKRLEVIGTTMRMRALDERIPLIQAFSTEVLPGFSAESSSTTAPLRPVVGATFPMRAIAEAHGAMERDEVFGKVVVEWGEKR